jgi:hypothetical protein
LSGFAPGTSDTLFRSTYCSASPVTSACSRATRWPTGSGNGCPRSSRIWTMLSKLLALPRNHESGRIVSRTVLTMTLLGARDCAACRPRTSCPQYLRGLGSTRGRCPARSAPPLCCLSVVGSAMARRWTQLSAAGERVCAKPSQKRLGTLPSDVRPKMPQEVRQELRAQGTSLLPAQRPAWPKFFRLGIQAGRFGGWRYAATAGQGPQTPRRQRLSGR